MQAIKGLDGWRHLKLGSVDSTNTQAMKLGMDGDPGKLWITATEQLGGKARRGRSWVSKPGNMYASLLLVDVAEPQNISTLPLVVSLALHRAISGFLPEPEKLRIKWPNDLLFDGKKISGILLEGATDKSRRLLSVIGCGVNCRHFPDNPIYPATSFAEEGIDIPPEDLFSALSIELASALEQWCGGTRFSPIREAWLKRATGLGGVVVARFPDHEITGEFQDMDAQGRLVIKDADGQIHAIAAADIFFGDQGLSGHKSV